MKPSGAIALFAQQPFATELAASAPRKMLRYDWVWDKGAVTGFGNAKRMPLRRHENILIFYRERPLYQPQGLRPVERCRTRTKQGEAYGAMRGGAYVQTYTGYPQSILRVRRERRAAACQKPVELLEYLIRTYTREGETVLDNTMGLGSAGVAAVRCGRSFIGMEIDAARVSHGRGSNHGSDERAWRVSQEVALMERCPHCEKPGMLPVYKGSTASARGCEFCRYVQELRPAKGFDAEAQSRGGVGNGQG